ALALENSFRQWNTQLRLHLSYGRRGGSSPPSDGECGCIADRTQVLRRKNGQRIPRTKRSSLPRGWSTARGALGHSSVTRGMHAGTRTQTSPVAPLAGINRRYPSADSCGSPTLRSRNARASAAEHLVSGAQRCLRISIVALLAAPRSRGGLLGGTKLATQ